jgi:glycosyltransferase involved in cell wall biosynthesis
VARLLHIPLVVSLPGADVFVSSLNPVFLRMARFAFNQAGAITTNSEDMRLAAVHLGADAQKIRLIIYGVDPVEMAPDPSRRAALRARLGLHEDTLVVLACGRLVPKKGFDVLLKAVPAIDPSAHIVIVGNGEQRETLASLAVALRVTERVHFVGNVLRTDLASYFNMADIFAMPSMCPPPDGVNVAVVEAMSCGLPVVASTVGGNPLVVTDGDNGFLVGVGQAGELAAAINRLLANPAQRQAMGQRSRERVIAEFTWPRLAAEYIQLYAALAHADEPVFNPQARMSGTC